MWYAASLSPEELGAYADARVCLHRARYIRKAHINFLPQSEKPVALTFLNEISSAKVQSASPKLELKATRLKLPRTGETAPQCIKLTFVDERTIDLDLNKIVRLRCLPASAPTPYRQPPPPPEIQLPMAAAPPPTTIQLSKRVRPRRIKRATFILRSSQRMADSSMRPW
jgi:hypothetical protein